MYIKGKKVTLRAMELGDLELVRDSFNDCEIEDKVVGWAFPISKFEEQKWFESHYGDSNKKFIIETDEDGAVGLATLDEIDWKNRSATHGIKLFKKENRSKGIGTDTVMAIMRYAFDELGLHRLNGSWFPDNIPSKNLYMKLGWKVEGLKRESVYKHGEYRDLEISGILEEEYHDVAKKLNYWNEENK